MASNPGFVCSPWRRAVFPFASHLDHLPRSSQVAQMVKNLSVIQETQVKSLNWEDALEKGMAIHPILA